MKNYQISISDFTASFFEDIATKVGREAGELLADSLEKLVEIILREYEDQE